MRTIRIHSFGDTGVLAIEDIPRPKPKDDEVLIRVHAASVNPVDYKIRSGSYTRGEVELPATLGRDVAGNIAETGRAVLGFDIGESVFAFLGAHSGGYAEYAIAEINEVAPKPVTLDFVTAAAVPLAALTAWQGLFDHGELTTREQVLIHGAAGGVGHFAVQFAKARGATVFATARKEDRDLLKRLGCDHVIDYQTEWFEDHVHDIDLVLDLVGGDTQDRSWNVLRKGGRLISSLQQPSAEKARRHQAEGKFFMAKPKTEQLRTIAQLIDKGRVVVQVDTALPLDHVREAHERLENKHTQGKIVLTVA